MVIALIVMGIVLAILAAAFVIYVIHKRRHSSDIKTLVHYIKAQQDEAEQKQILKDLKTAEQKEKLENFKRTKEELKERLEHRLNGKEWLTLDSVLNKSDKGTIGIYVLFNETKNKYYVGQSKEVFARIKKHFETEQIARDFYEGDIIKVKMLNATELDTDYRIDHLEKTAIEIYDAAKNGYNKTAGNL